MCRLNKKLVPKGIRVLPLRVRKGRALIYAYRPNALESDLTDYRARALLLKYGYVPENPNGCVVHLIHRLRSEGEFPHEIGLFLSYPPEDVLGFICNRACNHKCVGCWKVYGDEQAARNLFEKYEMCSKIYSRQWQQGKSIEQLPWLVDVSTITNQKERSLSLMSKVQLCIGAARETPRPWPWRWLKAPRARAPRYL